jgi:hypothetical protein
MVSDLLEFSYDCCHLPDSYWLTPTARSNAGVQGAKDPGDLRRGMVLKMVSAFYGKKYCSFAQPREGEPRREDVYYFPDGACFCNEGKVSAASIASILSVSPNARLAESCIKRGMNHLKEQTKMLCDVQQPEGFTANVSALAPYTNKASSSKEKTDEKTEKKRPAADRK